MPVKSKQPRVENDVAARMAFLRSVARWVDKADLNAPPYGVAPRLRDEWLRAIYPQEPNLAGVIKSAVDIDKNRRWEITGGERQVRAYSGVLLNAEPTQFAGNGEPAVGKGWRFFFSQQSLAYYTADIGAVAEIGRDGEAGPMRALWNVDPCRCELTGSITEPLLYYPPGGVRQAWGAGDFMRAVSLPSTDETLNGLGLCAVSRVLDVATSMIAVYRHNKEKLLAQMPKGILLLRGITDSMWSDAMETNAERLTARERDYYAGLSILFGDEALDAKLVALSSLPDGFELKTVTDILMYTYALAFGYDPREFWPVSGGQLGTASETEAMAVKATSKGGMDFTLAWQDNFQRELPSTLLFEFEQRNEQGDIIEAQVAEAWARAVNEMAMPAGSGDVPTLSASERRQLLAQKGLIPAEWTEEEEDTTVSDTGNERVLDTPHVRRAMAQFPNEKIIRLGSDGRETVLYDPHDIRHFFFASTVRSMELSAR